MTYGSVLAFCAYAIRIFTPALRFSELSTVMAETTVSLSRIAEILNAPVEVKDVPDPLIVKKFRGDVRFENVSFEYEEGTPVIKNVHLAIPPGKRVALVSETGWDLLKVQLCSHIVS